MNKIWIWLNSWLSLRTCIRSDKLVRKAELRVKKSLSKLEKKKKLLIRLSKRLDVIGNSLVEDIDEASAIQKQCEESISAQQSELRIYSDITIPTLTDQHRLILERYDAEIAAEVRRRVAISANSNLPEG